MANLCSTSLDCLCWTCRYLHGLKGSLWTTQDQELAKLAQNGDQDLWCKLWRRNDAELPDTSYFAPMQGHVCRLQKLWQDRRAAVLRSAWLCSGLALWALWAQSANIKFVLVFRPTATAESKDHPREGKICKDRLGRSDRSRSSSLVPSTLWAAMLESFLRSVEIQRSRWWPELGPRKRWLLLAQTRIVQVRPSW